MWILMYVFSYSVSPAATNDRAEWRLLPTVVFQEFSNEVFGLVQDRLAKNVEAVNRILCSRSVPDFLAIQGDLARDTVWQVLDMNKHMTELSLRITQEAVRAIQAHANPSGPQIRRAA